MRLLSFGHLPLTKGVEHTHAIHRDLLLFFLLRTLIGLLRQLSIRNDERLLHLTPILDRFRGRDIELPLPAKLRLHASGHSGRLHCADVVRHDHSSWLGRRRRRQRFRKPARRPIVMLERLLRFEEYVSGLVLDLSARQHS